MCQVHKTLQELQAVMLMLYRMPFHLSGKVVPLQLDKLIYVIKMVQHFLILLRFACHILNLANKHDITLLFQHTYLPISMWKPSSNHREDWFNNGISSSHSSSGI